jgi:gluconate 2-dehydrogenase gamma chain
MKTRSPYNPRRRRFVGAAAVAAAGGMSACAGRGSAWRFLTDEEAATLNAACDRIIPPDEFPGAAWAGATRYIDRQLFASPQSRHREAYRRGVPLIEQTAREMFRSGFAALEPAQQDETLRVVEKKAAAFFALLVQHTMQSYYGDPRHGGNRDGVGWRSIGVPITIVRGRSQHDLTRPEGGKA